ncbi:MAG TPA: MOSC N-terminal beta barrel domain-containing protein [Thermoleophilaceae bacterium]
MRVAELWRYPVKSLLGERLESAAVMPHGFEGDRRFAIYDVETGFGLTARRVPELLFASARLRDDGSAEITLPDGSTALSDEALCDWLGRGVTLRSSDSSIDRRYENPDDFEHEDASHWTPFDGADGPFHDSARTRVSLLSKGTIGAWDPRRFRSNVLLDGEGEDALVGSAIELGEVRLDVVKQIDRCVMTTRPQAGGIERDLDVLRTIARERDAFLAIGALVEQTGTICVGDELTRV